MPTKLLPFFLYIIKPYKWLLFSLLFCCFLWAIHSSLTPYILKIIIDKIGTFSGDKADIFPNIIIPVIIYISIWVCMSINFRVADYIKLVLFPNVRVDIINKMFAYMNRHSYGFMQNNFAGSLSNKVMDMAGGSVSILNKLDEFFSYGCSLIIAIIFMFFIHPIFSTILTIWALAFFTITIYFNKKTKHLSYIFSQSKSTLSGKIVDGITNINNIRLFSQNKYEEERLKEATGDTAKKDRDMQKYLLKMRICWDVVILAMQGLMLITLVILYSKHKVTIGDFAFIMTVSLARMSDMWSLASGIVSFAEDIGKCSQAVEVISKAYDVDDVSGARDVVITKGEIEFRNVSFGYHSLNSPLEESDLQSKSGGGSENISIKKVLQNETIFYPSPEFLQNSDSPSKGELRKDLIFSSLNLQIKAGEKVGLVGQSGAGKTTLAHLILRLFDIQTGQILIDNQDIKYVTQASLRDKIALIPQDITLFHRSLMENIRYGKTDASDEEVINASKLANCHEFIMNLPNGYGILVGERGIKLSGGQRQRIAIARAILKDSPILILDEATSSLDSKAEKDIQESLNILIADKNKTVIAIAHRLSTLKHMDRIIVLDNGNIVEEGKHDKLIVRDDSLYKKLWELQEI